MTQTLMIEEARLILLSAASSIGGTTVLRVQVALLCLFDARPLIVASSRRCLMPWATTA